MPAHRVPPEERVDNRPQRQGLALVVAGAEPPAPAPQRPEPPPGLLPQTLRAWEAFWASRIKAAVAGDIEVERLERWAYTLDEWYRVSRVVRRRRLMFTPQGTKLNPLIPYLRQLEGELARCEAAFGMTPLARARMGLTVAEGRRTAAELNRMLEGTKRDRGAAGQPSGEGGEGEGAPGGDDWAAGFEAG